MSKARIRFGQGDEWCEATLHTNGTMTFHAGEALRTRLADTGDRLDKKAVMFGASAFMGLSAIGATLVLKRKPAFGFVTLFLAALVALFGSRVRTVAQTAFHPFDTPLGKDRVQQVGIEDGRLVFVIAFGVVRYTLSARVGEYDAHEAEAFVAAWTKTHT